MEEKKGPVVTYQAQCGQEGEACTKHLLAKVVFVYKIYAIAQRKRAQGAVKAEVENIRNTTWVKAGLVDGIGWVHHLAK